MITESVTVPKVLGQVRWHKLTHFTLQLREVKSKGWLSSSVEMDGEPRSCSSVSDGYRTSQRIMKESQAEKYETPECANLTTFPPTDSIFVTAKRWEG